MFECTGNSTAKVSKYRQEIYEFCKKLKNIIQKIEKYSAKN